jgi:hypothetical protein
MKSNNRCALPFKLRKQLEINVEQDLDKGVLRIGDHVDIRVFKIKSLKGLLPKPIYNKNNH